MRVSVPIFLMLPIFMTFTNLLTAQTNSSLQQYTVTSSIGNFDLSDNETTLGEALYWANTNGGNCTIAFSPELEGSRILLLNTLPALTQSGIVIHAKSEIILDGSCLPNVTGIKIKADDCKVFGLTFQNFRIGIHVANGKSIVKNTILGKQDGNNQFRFVDNPNYPDNNFECAILANNTDGLQVQANIINYEYEAFNVYNLESIWSGIKVQNSKNIIIKNNAIHLGSPNLINSEVVYYCGIYLANIIKGNIEKNSIDGLNNDRILGKQDKGVGIFTIGEYNTSISVFENSIVNCGYGILDIGNETQLHLSKNAIYHNCKSGIERSPRNKLPTPNILSINDNMIKGISTKGSKVEIFTESAYDGPCQGRKYIGFATADSTNRWEFKTVPDTLLSGGLRVSATATYLIKDITQGSIYNTSEFSGCMSIDFNDEYTNAYSIPVRNNPCALTYVSSHLQGATASIPENWPINNDSINYQIGGHNDIWFKVIIPHSGRLLIKQFADTEIETHIDVWKGQLSSQVPSYRIKGSFDELHSYLQFHVIPDTTFIQGDTLYIRVWDKNDTRTGTVSLAAHMLSESPLNPVLCDELEGTYADKQFIVKYHKTVSRSTIDEITEELLEEGDFSEEDGNGLLDYYYGCDSFYIQLWGVGDITELETCRQVATKKAEVDTTYLNLVFDNLLCMGYGEVTDFYYPSRTNTQRPGEKINVALIDSGLDPENYYLRSYVEESTILDPDNSCGQGKVYSVNFANEKSPPIDSFEHGNAVGGTIINGMSPEVNLNIINLKAFNGKRGSFFDLLEALAYAIDNDVDIINFSGGFERKTIPKILDTLLIVAKKKEILIVTSAGNLGRDLDQEDYNKWPASASTIYTNIITVGAYFENKLEDKLIRAYFSNYGELTVDIFASGLVQSTALGSSDGRGLRTFAGTSLSAPAITRLATILKSSNPLLRGTSLKNEVLNAVKNMTLDVSEPLEGKHIYHPQNNRSLEQSTIQFGSQARSNNE